jgi:uncharacterized protein DUF707
MKPYLAIFRTGSRSLHPHAVARLPQQNFDYGLSHYGDDVPHSEGAVFVHRQPGAKWPGLLQTLKAHCDVIARYRYVWLPDDDLLCEPEGISRMFAVCEDLRLELAQPALTLDSYFTHMITLQHRRFQVRFTNFVEIMAPVLSASLLARAVPTMVGSLSGWGLDSLWPRMVGLGKVAIIDSAPIRHTRPISNGKYPANTAAGVPAITEDWLVAASSFIEAPNDFHLNMGGLLETGDAIALGSQERVLNALLHELVASMIGGPVTALQLSRYLSNHLSYATGGEHGRMRYPRDVVRSILNNVLRHTGIRFNAAPAQQLQAA